MKKLMIAFLCILMLNACGHGNTETKEMELLIGQWQCEENPLETEEYYTGFIAMDIQEDGSFRMTDVEAGNPVISGNIEIISDKELVLTCNTEEDFDPPSTWQSMKEEQTLEYCITEDGKLHMTYNEGDVVSTLVFVKQ